MWVAFCGEMRDTENSNRNYILLLDPHDSLGSGLAFFETALNQCATSTIVVHSNFLFLSRRISLIKIFLHMPLATGSRDLPMSRICAKAELCARNFLRRVPAIGKNIEGHRMRGVNVFYLLRFLSNSSRKSAAIFIQSCQYAGKPKVQYQP